MQRTPVFVHIPKTAGNSVRDALNGRIKYIDIKHSTIQRQNVTGPEYFRFCFVRNPFARLRSAFFHLVDFNKSVPPPTKFEQRRANLYADYGDDFERFVLDHGFEKHYIVHFFRQTRWTHQDGVCLMDFVGHVEEMDSEWKRLCDLLGVGTLGIERKNQTKSVLYKTNDYYTSKMKEIVVDFYYEDFKKLGY